jgi:uncharacterized protein GlcG (DUF336 family)
VLRALQAGAITEREMAAASGTNWLGLAPGAVVAGLAEERLAGGRTALLALDGMVPVAGGVPIVVGGRIIGAVGVSGASSAQDDEIARAAIAAALGG